MRIGALVPNSDLAYHPLIEQRYPLLGSAILAGASPQLRNMASTGGNLLQRTRCAYFYDTATPCNKREPGSGCSAINGVNRIHAILGASEACIATHPSDMCVALAALDATVHVAGPAGERVIAFADFHRLPGDTPQIDTKLQPNEIITAIELPAKGFAANYSYLKIRDRLSYAFALVSVAAALELKAARSRMRGSRSAASRTSRGATPRRKRRCAGKRRPGELCPRRRPAAAGRQGLEHNAFKIELARRAIVRTLTQAARARRNRNRTRRSDETPINRRHLLQGAVALGASAQSRYADDATAAQPRSNRPCSEQTHDAYIGTATSRVDGRAKVTGEAKYAGEFNAKGLAYGASSTSTIAKGRIARIDTSEALRVEGVLDVLTHENRPQMADGDEAWKDDVAPEEGSPFRPLYDDKIMFSGQPIALVLAEEWEIARYAASLVRVDYEKQAFVTDLFAQRDEAFVVEKPDKPRGDAAKAFAAAAVRHEAEYFIPTEHHNPMELFASTVMWDGGGKLTVYDKTQGVQNVQRYLCGVFDKKSDDVARDVAVYGRRVRRRPAAAIPGGAGGAGRAGAGALGAAGADAPADVRARLPAGDHRAPGARREGGRHARRDHA